MSQPDNGVHEYADELRRDWDWIELECRAVTAEDELQELRIGIRELQAWLSNPIRGPIIFRSEVVERLEKILAL